MFWSSFLWNNWQAKWKKSLKRNENLQCVEPFFRCQTITGWSPCLNKIFIIIKLQFSYSLFQTDILHRYCSTISDLNLVKIFLTLKTFSQQMSKTLFQGNISGLFWDLTYFKPYFLLKTLTNWAKIGEQTGRSSANRPGFVHFGLAVGPVEWICERTALRRRK